MLLPHGSFRLKLQPVWLGMQLQQYTDCCDMQAYGTVMHQARKLSEYEESLLPAGWLSTRRMLPTLHRSI